MDRQPTKPLAQVAYDELKYRIIRLTLAPGQWITEKAVAEQLGLGLAPVRAALARLSNEGLVVVVPRRGYRVMTLTLKGTDDLFATWKIVACGIMRLATLRMTTEALATYMALNQGLVEDADDHRDEIDVWLDTANKHWHFFAQLADNDYLLEIFLRLESQLSRVFALTFSSSPAFRPGNRQEKITLHSLRDRDADAIVAETARFLDRSHRETRRALTGSSASALVDLAV